MAITKYRCFYWFRGSLAQVDSSQGFCRFSDGFWINDTMQLSLVRNAKYWIPPSKIEYIERVAV